MYIQPWAIPTTVTAKIQAPPSAVQVAGLPAPLTAGTDTLNCMGWVKPANTFVFFLSGVYTAMNNSASPQPEIFDSAYLLRRYRREYDMLEIPPFVKKVIFPAAYGLGTLLGKYRKFRDAPQPM